jgi:hypothetical protein
VHAQYRFGHYAELGVRYAYSRLQGPADDVGPFGGSALAYPEYFDAAWHQPEGRLANDVPLRLRLWGHAELFAHDRHGVLLITGVHTQESGRPYGASALVAVAPYVENPGYAQPPAAVRYFFTAPDAFRSPGQNRTDVGLSYRRPLGFRVHGELLLQLHVLNLFNSIRVLNPGQYAIARTAFTDASLQPFNPFTDVPVAGVHWTFEDQDAELATARPGITTTLPRAVRVIVGIRF